MYEHSTDTTNRFPRNGLKWSARDLALLKINAGKISADEIAYYLRRDVEAVHIKASRLGISLVTNKCKRGHARVYQKGRWRCPECRKLKGY